MKLITKKNFIPSVCTMFTLFAMIKVIGEFVFNNVDENYQENFMAMFVFTVLATFVLSLQYYLQSIPIVWIMIGQYVVLCLLVLIYVWISGQFSELHPDAYRDMFWSFTICYIIGAAIYYASLWNEVKRTNKILEELNNDKREGKEGKV